MANEYNYNAPEVELEVLSVTGDWNPEDFVFSLTSNTELLKKGTLFIKAADSGTNIVASVINFSNTGDSDYAIRTPLTTPSNSLVSALPVSGVETTSNFTIASRDLLTSIFVDDVEKVRVTLSGTTLDNLIVSGDLVVSGTLTADIPGLIDLSQPLALGSSLTVTGSSILLDDLSVSGNSYLNTLSVSGAAALDSLTVTGSTTLLGGLNASGLTALSGLSVGHDADVLGDLTVSGDLTVAGMIYADLGTAIDLSSPVELGSTLEVTGATTLQSTLSVADLATLSGLVVQNDVDVTGNVYITGDLVVSGNIISDSLVGGGFDPSLALTLGSTLNVSGATTLESTLVVSGASTLHDNLNVSGLATLSGLTVQNDVDVTGNVAITGSLTVSGGIVSSTITDIQSDIAVHEDRLDVMDIIDGTDQAVVFENNAIVFADAHPGVQDPDYREGWYFKNEGPVGTNQNKVNWYFDGHPSPIHLDEFSVYTIITFDSITSKPHLAVYTEPQGAGDAAFWYRSKRVYVSDASATVGVKYLMYFGEDPKVRPDLPRLTTTLASSEGPQDPTETILAAVLGSDSATAIGNCEFVAESVGSYSPNFKRLIKLDIRKPSVTNVQTWDADVLSDANLYTDNALVDLVSNPVILGSTLEVTGIVTLRDDLNVSGLTTTSGLVVQNDVDVTGNVAITGDLVVSGNIISDSLPAPFDPSAALILGSTLEVSGGTTLRDNLVVEGLATVSGITVQHNVDVTGNVTITGDLVVSGNIISDSLPAAFDPSLALTLGSTLNVSGATTLESTLVVSGASTLHNDLSVSGLSTLSGVVVQNDVDVTGNVYITGDLVVSGNIISDSLVGGGFDPSLALTLGSTLNVSGVTTLESTLVVSGSSTLADVSASGLFEASGLVVQNDMVVSGAIISEGFNSYKSTGADATTSGSYAPILNVSLDSKGKFTSLTLLVSQDGGSPDADRNSALVHFRIKQQDDMFTTYLLPPDTVTLSEAGLAAWSAIEGATLGYEYQITTANSPNNNNWISTMSTSVSEDLTGYGGQTVYLYVKAFGAISYNSASVYVNYVAPSSISITTGGTGSWSSVANAPGYQYQLASGTSPTGSWSLQTVDTSVTGLTLDDFIGSDVYFHVRVTDSTNSGYGSVYVPFAAPTGIALSVDGDASWFAVANAPAYEYQVTTGSTPTSWTATSNLSVFEDIAAYAGQTVNVFVRVSGTGNLYGSGSAVSAGVPDGLAFNTYTSGISWNAVSGANLVGGYKYKVSTYTDPANDPASWISCATTSTTADLSGFTTPGETIYLHVRVFNSNRYASLSTTMPVPLTNVILDTASRTATWDTVGGGLSYQYQINQSSVPASGSWLAVVGTPPVSVNLSQYAANASVYFHVRVSGISLTENYHFDDMPNVDFNTSTNEATWDLIPNASGSYQYQVSTTSAPMPGNWVDTDDPPETVSLASIPDGQNFYFFVRASGGAFYNYTSDVKPISPVAGLSLTLTDFMVQASWTAVPTNYYEYKVLPTNDSSQGSWTLTTQGASGASIPYPAGIDPGNTAHFFIRVQNTPGSQASTSSTRPYPAPSSINFDGDGNASWSAVTNANSYEYQTSTSNTPTSGAWVETFSLSASLDINAYAGTLVYFFVRVKTNHTSSYGTRSATAYGVPSSLSLDTYNSIASWSSVAGAAAYKYQLNTSSSPSLLEGDWVNTLTTSNAVDLSSYTTPGQTVYLFAKVSGSAQYNSTSSTMPVAVSAVTLDTSARIVDWDQIANVDYEYIVTDSGTSAGLTWVFSDSTDVLPLSVDLNTYEAGSTVNLFVRAYNLADTESSDSMAMPSLTLNTATNSATWDALPGAVDNIHQYQVSASSSPTGTWTSVTGTSVTGISFSNVAEGAGLYFFVSLPSWTSGDPYLFTTGTRPYDQVAGLSLSVIEPNIQATWTAGAGTYEYKITSYSDPLDPGAPAWSTANSGDLPISVQSNDFDQNSTVYLFVQVQNQAASRNSTSTLRDYLPAPANVSLSTSGVATWDAVAGALAYQYNLVSGSNVAPSGAWLSVPSFPATTISFSGYEGQTLTFHVRASGSTNFGTDFETIAYPVVSGLTLNTTSRQASWSSTSGVVYQYKVTSYSSASDPLAPAWSSSTATGSTVTITGLNLNSFVQASTVYLHVRVNEANESLASTSTAMPTVSINGETGSATWSGINGGGPMLMDYEYLVSATSTPQIGDSWTTVSTPSATVTFPGAIVNGQTFYFFVRASGDTTNYVYATGTRTISTVQGLTFSTSTRIGSFTSDSGLNYQYKVTTYSDPNNVSAPAWNLITASGSTTTVTGLNLNNFIQGSTVYWHVRKENNDASKANTSATMPIITINGETGAASWSGITPGGAFNNEYQYLVSTASMPMFGDTWTTVTSSSTTVTFPGAITNGQTFYFFVRTSGDTNNYVYTTGTRTIVAATVSGLTLSVGIFSATGNWTYNAAKVYQYQFRSSATPDEGMWSNTQFTTPPVNGSSSSVAQGSLLYFIVQESGLSATRSSISGTRPYFQAPSNVTFNSSGYATWDSVAGASAYEYQTGRSNTPTGAVWTVAPFAFPPSVTASMAGYSNETVYFFVRVSGSINYGSASAFVAAGGGGGGMPPP